MVIELNVGMICLFYLTSVWMLSAQADTIVSSRSRFTAATQKPPDDAILVTLPEIHLYQQCLGRCNKLETSRALVYQEGIGCTLYNSSSLTEPLVAGEQAASSTNKNVEFREEPPFVYENMPMVIGMPGSTCSQHSNYDLTGFGCNKVSDGKDNTWGSTSSAGNINKWYRFNFPQHEIYTIHFRQKCQPHERCSDVRLELGGTSFMWAHDCSQPCTTYDKIEVPGGKIQASSLRLVCTGSCQAGGGSYWGFYEVRAFTIKS